MNNEPRYIYLNMIYVNMKINIYEYTNIFT